MVKNLIQEQRMKGYFIQATKEILKGEGLKSVNVRAVAERAGYSYATLYNYFKDIRELVFICVGDFQEECSDFVNSRVSSHSQGLPMIKEKMLAYIDFFVQYPGIFELFYLERLSILSGKHPVAERITDFPAHLCNPEWEFIVHSGHMTEAHAERKKQEINSIVTGLLLLYLNRQCPLNYVDFISRSGKAVDTLLGLNT